MARGAAPARLASTARAHGTRLVVLARFAIFLTGLLAATAGTSGMKPVRYFPPTGRHSLPPPEQSSEQVMA